MNPTERPSQRLRLLPAAVGWLGSSVIISLIAVLTVGRSGPRMPAGLAVLAGAAMAVGIVMLAGYVLARVLEQLHLWQSSKAQATGRDWYEA